MKISQRISLIYLYLVPPMAAVIGFGIGHVNEFLYYSLWVINICLMMLAVWQLIKQKANLKKNIFDGYLGAALFLIIPWILYPIFAGMGPPPLTLNAWLATITEQQVRYTILIIGGVSTLMGLTLLNVKLKAQGETFYSIIGMTAANLAIPLFILNMIFWGYYLSDVFKFFITLPQGKRPEWYPPIKQLFYVISVIEVFLTYLAIALFAIALNKINVLNFRSVCWYFFLSVMGMILVLLPPSIPEPISFASYLAAIPAIPFMMSYLMGLRLLRE